MTKALRENPIADYAIILLGAALSALSVVVFVRPAEVPLGGITGIALMLNYLFGLPVGVMTIALNIPLLLVAYRQLGHRFIVKTAVATVASSLLIDLFSTALPFTFEGDRLLGALYGGVLSGAGVALTFMRGGTLGGTDIISKIISRKTGQSVGSLNLVINAAVIGVSAFVYVQTQTDVLESILYAIIIQAASAMVVNNLLTGLDNSNAVFIVTDSPEEVSASIFEKMERGVTALSAKGMYTHSERVTLLCAVRQHEVTTLKKVVTATDPEAFMIVTNAREVLGRGFKQPEQ